MNVFIKKTLTTIPKEAYPFDAGYDLIATSYPKIIGLESLEYPNFYYNINYIEYETDPYPQLKFS